ncbi:GntR family transcriptional regulator [Bacillus pseudomycoides]|uniref:GntR family transcriptional regulator n=1 Tax=Bacillus pseudomycoides TaxID=64104 RepID=UPI000BECFC94|nr:GntR family transcriptional regulator [Bacillus pseudomycoides]MED1624869.1 GntR family transcriptional regulator [Bacillus pseudomycoides]PDZ71462.1 GntR family transcriptional regulator [Bacillus pseudomycoides]PEO52658.1 GntR family transcriptional regulator [Bacillus pseudomycoides]PHC36470.1 GntR family transcriptional regulator [Bacillus pseudomycoides]
MNIAISNTSEKPIYQQLFEQISAQILKGELEGGYCLPPIRQAAKELRVSIITVKKAWEELERCGLINTITGKGCFVAEFSSNEILRIRNEMVIKQMVSDISYYKSFGLTIEEVIELLKKAYTV